MKLRSRWASAMLVATFVLAACDASLAATEPTSTPTVAPPAGGPIHALEGGVVEGPGGAVLDIPKGALDQDAEVSLETAEEAAPFDEWSLLAAAGDGVFVDLGGASLLSPALMTIPLDPGTVTMPDVVVREVVVTGGKGVFGVEVRNGVASFPILHPGTYQVFYLPFPGPGSVDRLHVPVYPGWADAPWGYTDIMLTDLAQYHTGAWPAGGLGGQWGETDRWYVTGNAVGLGANASNLPGVLAAQGYPYAGDASVPDPTVGLTTPDVEVLLWEFSTKADVPLLFPALKAYIHGYLNGAAGDPRPVSIDMYYPLVGSNGTSYRRLEFLGGGDLTSLTFSADSHLWSEWQTNLTNTVGPQTPQTVVTTVFLTPPRPENQRHGVLWLKPWHEGPDYEGSSLVLRRGPNHEAVSKWNHDVVLAHGYSYSDSLDQLPDDPEFGNAFTVLSDEDDLAYWFLVFNIADQPYEYHADAELFHEGDASGELLLSADLPFTIAPLTEYGPFEDTIPLAGKELGLYTLKITLSQGGAVQDVKYLQFRLAEPLIEPVPVPSLIPLPDFNPDPGPLFSTDRLFLRGRSCGPMEVMVDATFPNDPRANVVLFFRLKSDDGTTPWNSEAMSPLGGGMFTRTLHANTDFEGTAGFMEGSLQVQFVLTDTAGNILGRSDVFTDLMVKACRA